MTPLVPFAVLVLVAVLWCLAYLVRAYRIETFLQRRREARQRLSGLAPPSPYRRGSRDTSDDSA